MYMRGPGAVPGLYALEAAMNELADELKIDPVKLRILNDAEKDEEKNIPFSSRHYRECLEVGAKKFGWEKRTAGIGSMRRDGKILGWGLAGASWVALRLPCTAHVEFHANGRVSVRSGTQDIGTGTYTTVRPGRSREDRCSAGSHRCRFLATAHCPTARCQADPW